MYTETEIIEMHRKLLEVQREKKLFVTVREAGEVLGNTTSTSSALYKINALIELGLIEKVRNHYHVKDPNETRLHQP